MEGAYGTKQVGTVMLPAQVSNEDKRREIGGPNKPYLPHDSHRVLLESLNIL